MKSREVQITTPSDREIAMTRDFRAPRARVWEAHTRPELLRRWLLGPPGWTMEVCEIDFRVGGRYRYEWRKESGVQMGMGGAYLEITAPERIVATELFDDDWTGGGEAVATLVLTERDGLTTLVNTVRYPSQEVRDRALQSGMEEGVDYGYNRLAELLATPPAA